MTLSHEQARTMAIVKELMKGKRLTLDDQDSRRILVMGEDMTIGFLSHKRVDGKWEEVLIQPLDDPIDLAGLNDLLNRYEISFPIPNQRELAFGE